MEQGVKSAEGITGTFPETVTKENLWEVIEAHQGELFYTAKQLPFTYVIRGGEFFTERKKKSITRATFEKAFQKVMEDTEHTITGPKKLNVFGAPYVFAVFCRLGILKMPDRDQTS